VEGRAANAFCIIGSRLFLSYEQAGTQISSPLLALSYHKLPPNEEVPASGKQPGSCGTIGAETTLA
jgi:hypothetical protein